MSVTTQSLQRLLDPKSIAIVGLSSDPTKHGRRVLAHLKQHGFAGDVWGVNPKRPDVPDVDVFPTVADLPAAPDVLVLTVPAHIAPDVIADAEGAGAAIVFAGGFAESGDEGGVLQERLVAAAQSSQLRLLGPNSGGVIRPGLPISFLTCLDRPVEEIRHGPVGLVTQSGGTGSYMHNLAAARGSGFAMSISTGNEVDIGVAEAIVALTDRPDVEVVAVVMETIRNGPDFIEAVRYADAAGKRVVAARFGTSEHGMAMLRTHTAALAHPQRVLDGVLRSLGVPTAETPSELLEVAEILARAKQPSTNTVGIVTHSGGVAILLADLCERYRVSLADPSDELIAVVTPLLEHGAVGNPLDMGGIIGGPHRFAEIVERFAAEYDTVLAVSSAHPPAHSDERVAALLDIKARTPIVHLWMAGDLATHALGNLRKAQAPVTEEPRAAIRALAAMTATPALGSDPAGLAADGFDPPLSEHEAKRVLARWGIPTVDGRAANSIDEAVAAADEIGYPIAVKVAARGLIHKTDVGGVIVNLASADGVAHACEQVIAGASSAGFQTEGVLVEAMAEGPEVIVGATRDETFGPMVLVGLGGVLAEARSDVAMALAPISQKGAVELIDSIEGLQAFSAPRRGTPADLDQLAGIVRTLGDRLVVNESLSSVEINPLTWANDRWTAVDAVIF